MPQRRQQRRTVASNACNPACCRRGPAFLSKIFRGRNFLGRLLLALLIVAAQLPLAAPLQAKDPSKLSAADKELARRLMDEADGLLKDNKQAEALEKYIAADKLIGVSTTAVEVAKTYLAMGKLLEARDAYLRAVRAARYPDEPDALAEARAAADVEAQKLSKRIPSVSFSLSGLKVGIEPTLTLDGKALSAGAHKFPRPVNPGDHAITASATGYHDASATVSLAEGETKTVALEMKVDPNAAPPPKLPDPIDKKTPVGPTPPGDQDKTSSGGGMPIASWIGFGIGATGLAVGAVAGILSLDATAQLEDSCSEPSRCPASAQDNIDSATRTANVSNVGFIIGGVGTLFGVIALFTMGETAPAAKTDKSTAVQLEPLLGPTSIGLTGRF